MIKLIISILIVILVILGGIWGYNELKNRNICCGSNTNNNSNIDTAPSAEFTDLNNSDNVFNEIDSAIASLGQ